MRALKILVVVLGVLLAAGIVALAVAITLRIERGPARAALAVAAGPVRAMLPEGGWVVATELSGDRVLVRVALPSGEENLMLFDARTGAPVAVIELRAPGTTGAPP
jgi:hypothetical protein